jgi:hypothetical protein
VLRTGPRYACFAASPSAQLEEKEKLGVESETAMVFARKEALFRQQQQAELAALLKRIEARRKEHIKQRNLDSKRLMQRNRNVQGVLESKQAVESNRVFAEIRKNLTQVARGDSRPTEPRFDPPPTPLYRPHIFFFASRSFVAQRWPQRLLNCARVCRLSRVISRIRRPSEARSGSRRCRRRREKGRAGS